MKISFEIFALAFLAFFLTNTSFAAWSPLRTSGSGYSGWQPLICENGQGWQSCEMPVNIAMWATPASLVANGEVSTIYARVTDYYGVPIQGSVLNWRTTDGSISPLQTVTDAGGYTSINLTSSWTLGGATVTAETQERDGLMSIYVPFIDKWVAYPSTYSGWVNYGGVFSCTGWSPDPSTVPSGTWFTQLATCWQTQLQYRQDYVQSVVTGAVATSGAAVALFQNITVGVSQANVGTLYVPPPPPAGPVCAFQKGYTEIRSTTDCRGGGGPHDIRVNGVYGNSTTQANVNGKQGHMLNGIFYYRGREMDTDGVSCAGSEGVVHEYEACTD
jgi:hypothetical protein